MTATYRVRCPKCGRVERSDRSPWQCSRCGKEFAVHASNITESELGDPDEHLARARELHRIEGEIIEALAPFSQEQRFRILKAVAILQGLDVPGLTS